MCIIKFRANLTIQGWIGWIFKKDCATMPRKRFTNGSKTSMWYPQPKFAFCITECESSENPPTLKGWGGVISDELKEILGSDGVAQNVLKLCVHSELA